MSIGAGIFMVVLGAVLAFAVDPSLGGGFVNLDLIGYILMGAGAVVTLIGIVFLFKKRTTTTTASTVDSATGARVDRQQTVQSDPQTPVV